MKKLAVRIVAVFCIAAMVLCVSACKNVVTKQASSSSSAEDDIQRYDEIHGRENMPDEDEVFDDLSKIEITDVVNTETGYTYDTPKYNLNDRTVSFLSWWNEAETGFIIAYMKKYGGPQINFMTYSYSDTGLKLQAMVLADNSPDVFKMRGGSDLFSLMRTDVFSDVTNDFDWDSNNWKCYKDYLKYYTYKGKILATPENNANYFIWYNKGLFEEYGLEDPVKLFDKGEWTMDNFSNACRRLTIKEGGNTSIYGFGFDHCWFLQVLAMFDTNFAYLDENSVVRSNFADPKLDEAMNYVNQQSNIDKVYCDQAKANAYFASGKLAMLYYGNWLTSSEPFKSMNAAGKIDLVPCPSNPKVSKENRHWFNLDGHAIPVGAKHREEAKAFIEIFNYYKQTIDFDEPSREIELKSNGLTDAQYLRYRSVRKYKNPIFADINFGWDMLLSPVLKGENWLTVKQKCEPALKLVIEAIPTGE